MGFSENRIFTKPLKLRPCLFKFEGQLYFHLVRLCLGTKRHSRAIGTLSVMLKSIPTFGKFTHNPLLSISQPSHNAPNELAAQGDTLCTQCFCRGKSMPAVVMTGL